MSDLVATWVPDGAIFFWSPTSTVEVAAERELPALLEYSRFAAQRNVPLAGGATRRRRMRGFEIPIAQVLPLLASLPRESGSDSVRCWHFAALLALELAARQRVVPTVRQNTARWRVLLNRRHDRERFEGIAHSLPIASRGVLGEERGAVRLPVGQGSLRAFMDAVVDYVYRQDAWPGSSRGWARDFADALRGSNPNFHLRAARDVGVPHQIAAWSSEGEVTGLRVGVKLMLPLGEGESFKVDFWVHPADDPGVRIGLDEAWGAGASVTRGERVLAHPAHSVIRDLARMRHIFAPLGSALDGVRPHGLVWDVDTTWAFLSKAVPDLREAGFEVAVPESFAESGSRRIRAQMRLEQSGDAETLLDLGSVLRFRWEVVLGDRVLTGAEFTDLLNRNKPIVRFKGDWVLLDPSELARLPDGLLREGTLNAAEALRALLVGEHQGVPVVSDDRLSWVVEALRAPPEQPVPTLLNATLRPYQVRGYSWLVTLADIGLGACLADDMGLGKTVQVIAHMLRRKSGERAAAHPLPQLVVCPTSVLGNWARELARFAPSLRVSRYHGNARNLTVAAQADVVLTTYGLLVRDQELLSQQTWDVLVLDEAQAIKNPESQRARAARGLKARHRVALSGTPVENRLDELWSLMQFLVPGLLGLRARFQRTVAVPIERFGDQEVARQLKLGVSPFLLRRVKTDPTIISDLPEKIERRVFMPLTSEQAALYEQVVEESMERIQGAADIERRGHVLAMLTALKQICNHPVQYLDEPGALTGRSGKLDRALDLLELILAGQERAIVFTQYRQMGDLLVQALEEQFGFEAQFLHGGVPMHKRDELVRSFQEDAHAPPVLVISLRAGGVGLNLTRATHVVHYDRWWNPAVEDQATDRAYRIGQRRNVQVHKLICQGTLEERIDRLLEDKRQLAESVVGSGEGLVTELDNDALRALVALGDDAVMEDA
jgi:hypothetical protein